MRRKAVFLFYLTFALILAGLVARNGALVSLAFPILFYLGLGWLHRPQRFNLIAHRTLSQDHVSIGTPVEVWVRVENQGGHLDEVLLEDVLPPQVEHVEGETRLITSLQSGESLEFSYTIRCRRGNLGFPMVRARAFDAFGLFVSSWALPTSGKLIVIPDHARVRAPIIRPQRTIGFAGPIPAREGGAGTEFYGLREYQIGDPRRRINWRVSARRHQNLYSNEFEQERIAQIGIILDAREQSNLVIGQDALFEFSVQAAATLAEAFLGQGNRVGLLIYGYYSRKTFPGYGKVQLDRILNSLAEATTGHHFVFENLDYLPARFFPAHSQIVMVSPLLTTDLDVLTRLRALGYALMLVTPDPVQFESGHLKDPSGSGLATRIARAERRLLLSNLRRSGVQVIAWPVDQPLQPVIDQASRHPFQSMRQVNIRL